MRFYGANGSVHKEAAIDYSDAIRIRDLGMLPGTYEKAWIEMITVAPSRRLTKKNEETGT